MLNNTTENNPDLKEDERKEIRQDISNRKLLVALIYLGVLTAIRSINHSTFESLLQELILFFLLPIVLALISSIYKIYFSVPPSDIEYEKYKKETWDDFVYFAGLLVIIGPFLIGGIYTIISIVGIFVF